ncbi:hypothetical protein Ntsu_60020 [Nocardia sp. IFM 10818]
MQPLEAGLADLWRATAETADGDSLRRLRTAFTGMIEAWEWVPENVSALATPGVAEIRDIADSSVIRQLENMVADLADERLRQFDHLVRTGLSATTGSHPESPLREWYSKPKLGIPHGPLGGALATAAGIRSRRGVASTGHRASEVTGVRESLEVGHEFVGSGRARIRHAVGRGESPWERATIGAAGRADPGPGAAADPAAAPRGGRDLAR